MWAYDEPDSPYHTANITILFNIALFVICTDLSEKDPHRHVGVDMVIASGSLGSVMAIILVPEWQKLLLWILVYMQ